MTKNEKKKKKKRILQLKNVFFFTAPFFGWPLLLLCISKMICRP
jgi:hypothetical protein